MFSKLSTHLTDSLIQAEIINQAEKEIYKYGIKMMLTYLFNLITAFVIGITMGQLWECLILEVVFIPLRSYAGGYHASSEVKCYFLSAAMIVSDLILLRYLPIWFNVNIGILYLTVAVAVIMLLAPVENKNKPLDPDERRVYGHRTHIVLFVELVTAAFCLLLYLVNAFWVIVIGIFSVAFSLVAGACTNSK